MKIKILVLFVAGVLVSVLAVSAVSASGVPSPGDAVPFVPVTAVSDAQLEDAYQALSMGESAYQDAMNAVYALRKGTVAGVALTVDQKDALQDMGFAGLYNAKERYLNAVEILGISAAQLDAWELTNPQPVVCFETTQVGDCEAE